MRFTWVGEISRPKIFRLPATLYSLHNEQGNGPDTDHLIPAALEFLVKCDGEVRKRDLAEHLVNHLKKTGQGHRQPSIDFAPNRLHRAGLVTHPRHGYWKASELGVKTNPLSLDRAKEIMENCMAEQRAKRPPRKTSN